MSDETVEKEIRRLFIGHLIEAHNLERHKLLLKTSSTQELFALHKNLHLKPYRANGDKEWQ